MNKLLYISCLTFCFVSLGACKTTVQDGSTRVTVEDGYHDEKGEFCPPGQAKKGNC